MQIRSICRQKTMLALVAGTIICWTAAGDSFEQGDARAAARLNLRATPSLSGEILSIIPKGHKVRIVDQNGPWCRVDVQDQPNLKGWVYAKYLENILPNQPPTESSTRTAKIEIESGEQTQAIHPAEAVYIPPAQPAYSAFKQDARQIDGKDPAALIAQEDSTTNQERISGEKDKRGGAARESLPMVGEQPASDAPAMTSAEIRLAVSHETKGLILNKKSPGPVKIALKLLSIVLYGLLVLLLYKGY